MAFAQKQLEDQYNVAKMCAAYRLSSESDACYKASANLLTFFASNLDGYIQMANCNDSSFDMVRASIRDGLKMPIDKIADSLKAFASAPITGVPQAMETAPAQGQSFNFIQLYKDLKEGSMRNTYGCFRNEMQQAKIEMDNKYAAAQVCRKYRRKKTSDGCYNGVLEQLRAVFEGIDNDLEGARCSDTIFDPIRERVRVGLQLSEDGLIDAIKDFANASLDDSVQAASAAVTPSFAQIPIPAVSSPISAAVPVPPVFSAPPPIAVETPTFDFMQVYLQLKSKLANASCFKRYMEQCKGEFENKHDAARLCSGYMNPISRKGCLNLVLIQLQDIVSGIDKNLQGVRCVDFTFNPIFYQIKQGLQNPTESLLEDLRIFGNTPLDNGAAVAPMSPVAPASPAQPSLSATPQNSPSYDFVQVYKQIKDELKDAGCFKTQMVKAKTELENNHDAAQLCAQYKPAFAMLSCYNKVLQQITAAFAKIDDELTGVRCFDMTFDPIRADVRKGLQLPMDALIKAIIAFGRASIDDNNVVAPVQPVATVQIPPPQKQSTFDFMAMYGQLRDELKNAGCFKDQMAACKAIFETKHDEALACSAYITNKCYQSKLALLQSNWKA